MPDKLIFNHNGEFQVCPDLLNLFLHNFFVRLEELNAFTKLSARTLCLFESLRFDRQFFAELQVHRPQLDVGLLKVFQVVVKLLRHLHHLVSQFVHLIDVNLKRLQILSMFLFETVIIFVLLGFMLFKFAESILY
jgi:hypothetical protein